MQQQSPAAQRALHSSVQSLQHSGVHLPVQSWQQSATQQEDDAVEAAITRAFPSDEFSPQQVAAQEPESDAAMVCAPSHLTGQHVPPSIEAGETVCPREPLLLAQPETKSAAHANKAQQVITKFSFRDMV